MDFSVFMKRRDRHYMVADGLAGISAGCLYFLFLTDYVKKDAVALVRYWDELNSLFWFVLLILVCSLGTLFYVRHRMNKMTNTWRMRDEILILLAKDNEPLPSYLFALERDGYPVFGMVKQYRKMGLLGKYEEYLKAQHALYHNAVYETSDTCQNITKESQKNLDILGEILALPTWRSLELKENIAEGLRGARVIHRDGSSMLAT